MPSKNEAPESRAMLFPPKSEESDIVKFIRENGRMPFLSDDRKPWTYRGWLTYYVVRAHEVLPILGNRYGYLADILYHGSLPWRDIPQISFTEQDMSVVPAVEKIIAEMQHEGMSLSKAFRNLVGWISWAVGTSTAKTCDEAFPALSEGLRELVYRKLNLDPWMQTPFDYLGWIYSEMKGGGGRMNNPNAFYPTPASIVSLMSELTCSGMSRSDRMRAEACDPCVGSGRTLLAASNNALRLSGQDIDQLVCDIALINLALYAPCPLCTLGYLQDT